MQFRGQSTPPPYLNRRDQMRMLGLVLALGLVVFAIRVAGRPQFWAGIFPDEPAAEETERPPELPHAPTPADRDNLTVVPRDPATENGPATEAPAGDESRSGDGAPAERFAFDPRPPRVWFEPVRDHSLGVRGDEAPAHYGSLAMAANATLAELEEANEANPSRTNLMHFPEQYRGRIVTIEGRLERLLPIKVGGNLPETYGYDQLWEAWVSTPDAPRNPIRCLLTSLPGPTDDGRTIPQGERIHTPVKVRMTGYFFKVQAFDDGKGGTRTPLILGKQLRWFPPPPLVGDGRTLTPYVIVFASVVALSLAGVLFWYRLSDRRFADAHVRKFTEAPEGAIESLAGIETVDPADHLRQLAEAEEHE